MPAIEEIDFVVPKSTPRLPQLSGLPINPDNVVVIEDDSGKKKESGDVAEVRQGIFSRFLFLKRTFCYTSHCWGRSTLFS